MDFEASTRTTAVTASVMATGLAATLYGVIRGAPAHSIGGASLIMTALALIVLAVIRRWVTDTAAERRQLAAAIQAAHDERDGYFAAKAVLENDRQRLMRAAAADRAHAAASLMAERGKMAAEFEEKRATMICEAVNEIAGLVRSQKQKPPKRNAVIPFPAQQPVRAPQREHSRGHNVVGP